VQGIVNIVRASSARKRYTVVTCQVRAKVSSFSPIISACLFQRQKGGVPNSAGRATDFYGLDVPREGDHAAWHERDSCGQRSPARGWTDERQAKRWQTKEG
jgi:hypothetical protein